MGILSIYRKTADHKGWVCPPGGAAILLFIPGILGFVGQMCKSLAGAIAKQYVALNATIRSSDVIWSFLFGAAFLHENPTATQIVGVVIIVDLMMDLVYGKTLLSKAQKGG